MNLVEQCEANSTKNITWFNNLIQKTTEPIWVYPNGKLVFWISKSRHSLCGSKAAIDKLLADPDFYYTENGLQQMQKILEPISMKSSINEKIFKYVATNSKKMQGFKTNQLFELYKEWAEQKPSANPKRQTTLDVIDPHRRPAGADFSAHGP